MVGRTFVGNGWKSNYNVSTYTVEASNEDQALLMDIRKKDMIKNITIIMTFMTRAV